MPEELDRTAQESLDLNVEPDLIVLVRRLTELRECIRRSVSESDDARRRSALMGLEEVTHELDMARVRLARARQLLEQRLSNGESP